MTLIHDHNNQHRHHYQYINLIQFRTNLSVTRKPAGDVHPHKVFTNNTSLHITHYYTALLPVFKDFELVPTGFRQIIVCVRV